MQLVRCNSAEQIRTAWWLPIPRLACLDSAADDASGRSFASETNECCSFFAALDLLIVSQLFVVELRLLALSEVDCY